MTSDCNGYSGPVVVQNWSLVSSAELDAQSAVRQAREIVRTAIVRFVRHHVLFDALTATGEVVKNALQHACGPYGLTVWHDDISNLVRVGLSDGDPTTPQTGATDPWASNAHGLTLVDQLSLTWGTTPTGSGKEVWFVIGALPDEP